MREGISVIVLTKDRPDLFQACAASFEPLHPRILARYVVQHGSDQETIDIAQRFGWTVCGDGTNRSFSEAHNRVVRQSDTSHLLLMNNDARVTPGCIEALWQKRDHPLLGCLILDGLGRVNHFGVGYYAKSLMPMHLGRKLDPEQIREDRYAAAVTFATVMISRQLWDDLDGLDEEFWYSYEDVDFCARAHERGIMAKVVKDAVVYHDESSTREPQQLDPVNAGKFWNKWIKNKRLPDVLGLTFE